MTKFQAQSLVSQKILEIKSCIKTNRTAFSQNAGTIEALLDGILDGIAEESATVTKLRLVK